MADFDLPYTKMKTKKSIHCTPFSLLPAQHKKENKN
jgi:hypothetical protein